MYTMGLDIGSTASKGVVLKDGKEIVATAKIDFGTGTSGPSRVMESIFSQLEIERGDISRLVATGYGRKKWDDADREVSELSCHARGVSFVEPGTRTIIDIGGQDAKALQLDEKGRLLNFVMNDKCAAGTGRFLDVMADILETSVSELGDLSEKSKDPVSISSTCTVFAESEVISHLSNKAKVEDIVAGIHNSVVQRVSSLAKRVGIKDKVVMVGGVAKNKGVVKAMQKTLGHDIVVPEIPQLTGALGAALYAYDDVLKQSK